MRIVYRGNFQPNLGDRAFSTEAHVAKSMESLGHEVTRVQEDAVDWPETVEACRGADVFWWTQTWGMAHNWDQDRAREAIYDLNETLPTVGFHLDLFAGLPREDQLAVEPFFRVSSLFTADGDHDEVFAQHGIAHFWLPPAVYGGEVGRGSWSQDADADVAFVGSWQGGYHPEWWPQRAALLDWLLATYGSRVRFWPERHGHAIRGWLLNDLYASTRVVVGDSCFADRAKRYFSDRTFETVGRGGFLATPYIEASAEMLIDCEHLRYFPHGDFEALRAIISEALENPEQRERIVTQGVEHVRAHHTYAHRVEEVLAKVLA